MSAQQFLVSSLAPVGKRIKTVGFKHVKRMTRLTGHMMTHQDIDHLTFSAAFEAFLELGGNPDKPEEFDWNGRTKDLEKRGLLWLRRETIGRKTEFGEIATRVATRLNSAFVEGYRWSAWSYQPSGGESTGTGKGHGRASALEYVAPIPQETMLIEQELEGFESDLRGVIEDEQALKWVLERFRDGVSQNEQIERFVEVNPKYQGPGGRQRAEAYIHKKISRARQRASILLEEKWHDLAREVAS
jgi:hypothetical protein